MILTLFLSNLLGAGKLFGARRLEGEDQSPFLSLPFVTIHEICQQTVITHFDDWYSVWVPRYLWDKNNDPARKQGKIMKGSIEEHIVQMKEHIGNLEKEKERIDRFPVLLLDIKISRINGEVNTFINQEVPNKFDNPQVKEGLVGTHGSHIPDLINHYNSFSVGSELVKWVASSYRIDWDQKSSPSEPLTAKIDELADPLRKTLRTILKIHTQPSAEDYNGLPQEHKPTLQSFWDGFKFLLGDQPTVNDLIRDSLIQTGKAPVPEQTFFTPEFFQVLKSGPSDFKEELSREEFLTLDEPKESLEDIRGLAKPLFFSSDFPKEFTADPLYLNPSHHDSSVDPVSEGPAKKNAELHRILYIVYLLARLDNTIPPHLPLGNQDILKTLKDWVIQTKDFDELPEGPEPTDLEGIVSHPSEEPRAPKKVHPEQMHALLPPPVFKKHFLELVTLICSKIEGCEMKTEVKDPTLLDKVAEFGNFDDIRNDNPDAFLPKEIAEEVKENLAKHNIETIMFALDEELDDMLKDTPDFDDDELDEMDGQRFSDKTLGPEEEDEDEEEGEPIDEEPSDLEKPDRKKIERRPREKEPKKRFDEFGKIIPFKPKQGELDEHGHKIVRKPSDIEEPQEEEEKPSIGDKPSDLKKPDRKKIERRPKEKEPRKRDEFGKFIPFKPKQGDLDEQGHKIVRKPSDIEEPQEEEEEPIDEEPSDLKKPDRKKIERKPREKEPKKRFDKFGKIIPFKPKQGELDEHGHKIVRKPSDIEEPQEEEEKPSIGDREDLPDVLKVPTFQQVEDRRRKYQGRTSPKKNDKIAQILDRFIPKDGELDEQGRKFIEKLDDKAATSDPAKAADLKNIIIQFLIKRTELAGDKPDKKIEDITKLINKREVDRLMKPISVGSSAGLRNFFMMTLSNLQNLKYKPFSPLENKFYRHDLLFFVAMHDLDQMLLIASQKGKNPEELKKDIEPFTREIKIAMSHLTGTELNDRTDKTGKISMTKLKEEKERVLAKNTVLLHRMPAYHLFVALFDFFDYFKVAHEANAVYGNYRQVYLNFYSFLVSLRKTIPFEITHPHQYVLAQLELCLKYTATIETVDDQTANAVCMLSHRKYAEMYYFYKVYMLATNKPGASDLAPPAGMAFDTNVNIFLNFATQVNVYQTVMNTQCTPHNAFPICRSWTFFNALVNYLQLNQIALDIDSLRPVFSTPDFGTDEYLFNVLNAVDATILNVERGNMKDFAKYNLLKEVLQTLGIRFDSFEERHVKSLSKYLKRSYKRLFFSNQEVVANGLVSAILAGPESADSNLDSLKQVISLDNNYLPENLAFFLQLATTNQQFGRIAKLIIDTNAGSSLLNLRNEDNFLAYKNLVDNVASYQVTQEGGVNHEALNKGRLDLIRNFMHERVNKFSSMCIKIIRNEFQNQALEVEEFNMAEFLIDELDQDNKSAEEQADEKWVSVGEKIVESAPNQPTQLTTEQVISLEVSEEDAESYKAFFNLDKPNVVDFGVIENLEEGFKKNDYTLNGQTINPSDKNFIDARMEGLKKKLVEQLGAKKKDSQSASKKDLI